MFCSPFFSHDKCCTNALKKGAQIVYGSQNVPVTNNGALERFARARPLPL